MPTLNDVTFIQNFQDGGRIPEVVITLRQKRHQGALSGYGNVLGHVPSTSTVSTISDFGEQYQVQTGSRNSTQNRMFAPDAVF